MADAATATLSKRNGERKVFREAVVREIGQDKKNLDVLIDSLIKVQKQVNDALTEIVEAEKGTTDSIKTDLNVDNDDDDDDDDDDEDDNNENKNSSITKSADKNSREPVSKKPKTS